MVLAERKGLPCWTTDVPLEHLVTIASPSGTQERESGKGFTIGKGSSPGSGVTDPPGRMGLPGES